MIHFIWLLFCLLIKLIWRCWRKLLHKLWLLNIYFERTLSNRWMSPAGSRRHCFNVLVAVLVILSAVMLNVLYALAKNFVAMHREFWTQYTNHSHTHVPIWPSGYFPHNTYGFHPINEHAVYSYLLTSALLSVCLKTAEHRRTLPLLKTRHLLGKHCRTT